MTIRFVPAILERTEEGLHASFPDLPGCVTFGPTSEAVAANAETALALHIAGMIEDGESIPVPTALGNVPVDPEVEETGRLLVRAELPGRAVRVNITLDEALLAAIHAKAKARDTRQHGRRRAVQEPTPRKSR